MVQAGERIVDRERLLDNHTYNVLRSLKIVHETKSGGAQRQSIILGGQFVLVCGIIFCFWLYLWSFRLKILHNRRNALFLIPMHICQLHINGVMRHLCAVQCLYPALCDRALLLSGPSSIRVLPYLRIWSSC